MRLVSLPVVNLSGIPLARLGQEDEFFGIPAEFKKNILEDKIDETRQLYDKVVAIVNGFGGLGNPVLRAALGQEYAPFIGMYQTGVPSGVRRISERIASADIDVWSSFSDRDLQEVEKWGKRVTAMNDLLMRHIVAPQPEPGGLSVGTLVAGALGIGALIYLLA